MLISMLSLLAIGFVLGLKHALDADHLAAVSTMATERRSLLGSTMIGGLWGLGHTASLMFAGALVILFHIQIGGRMTQVLEFCVGLMLIGLGANALRKLVRGAKVHIHTHEHSGRWHVHPHLHEQTRIDPPHTHHGLKAGARPILVGLVHGMAGSGALMLLVLATTPSRLAGFLCIAVFGVGSIGGMMIMSTIFALPSKLAAQKFAGVSLLLQGLAGCFSVLLGLVTIYEIGIGGRLLI